MKKLFMMTMMVVFSVAAAFADDDEFKVVEGSFVDVVRQPGKTATVEFDYLNATIADKEQSGRTLKKWLQDEDPEVFGKWDKHMADAKKFFTKRWNEERMIEDDRAGDLGSGRWEDQIDHPRLGSCLQLNACSFSCWERF